jgi:hypothetical protein
MLVDILSITANSHPTDPIAFMRSCVPPDDEAELFVRRPPLWPKDMGGRAVFDALVKTALSAFRIGVSILSLAS